MALWKNIEKTDPDKDLLKELSSLKKEILWPQKVNKKVEEQISQTEKWEVIKETIEKDDAYEKLLEEYEKSTKTKESYSGGGVPPKIKTKKLDYDDDNDWKASYILPQRSLAAKAWIKIATTNVEKDITDMTSSILWQKTGQKVTNWFVS